MLSILSFICDLGIHFIENNHYSIIPSGCSLQRFAAAASGGGGTSSKQLVR